ncbi:MAG: alpha/beta hydrolase [Rickettsiales bacterium]|nr:alpha/beta hydrolase [Pseudomonadota bacterium]MDG4543518.1 alpha/beta hydrolase [Rickettsiales bacterium]MDG4545666.1 alpha/beta hydrolase [Rickettsiales bacterium]MDG4547561.1 alpha/beta hydrolase [Rickettsiales bacterium]
MSNFNKVKSYIMDTLIQVSIGLAIGYAILMAGMFFFQRSLLYHPVKQMAYPKNYGMDVYNTEIITLKTEDDNATIAWFTPPKKNKPIMVYYHGNAGNLGDRAEKLKAFLNNTGGYGQLAVSWRGYGGSSGSPTEQGLYSDARAAIDYLINKGYKAEDIFLYGESLGTGAAVQMATEYPVKALILEAPFTSVSNRAAELYPYIPARLLLRDKYLSIDKIDSVKAPVLIFHGYLDNIMPIAHGRKMLEAANEPKEARFYENIGHTNFNFNEISTVTYEFIENIN